MVDGAVEPGEEQAGQRPRGPFSVAVRRLLKKKLAVVALAAILVFYVGGILSPIVAPQPYCQQNLDATFQGPSMSHPFGTDRLGRDVLSRVLWSARTTVIVTVSTILTGGLVLAVGLGLLSGYRAGSWVDTAIMRVGDLFACLPGLPMLILITATLGPRVERAAEWLDGHFGLGNALTFGVPNQCAPAGGGVVASGLPDYLLVFGALSLFSWVGGARIIRSQVLALRETDYVRASQAMGAQTGHVLWRHLLPNVAPIIIVSMSAGLGAIAGSEVALSWLGVGIHEPMPSFGILIFEGSGLRAINAHPYLLLVPGIIVATLIFAFNLLGDALNDVLTPRAR